MKVGQMAKSLKVGDRVFCSSEGGAFTSRLVLPEDLCFKIPDKLSMTDAATMPIVYCTAMYCLEDLAHINVGKVRRRTGIPVQDIDLVLDCAHSFCCRRGRNRCNPDSAHGES